MKRFSIWFIAVFILLPILALAAAAPEVADDSAGFLALLGTLWAAIKSGQNSLAAGTALAALITILRNSEKIDILAKLQIHKLVTKIPKAWFTPIVAVLSVALAVVSGIVQELPLKESLQFGLETAIVSAGLHEAVKRPLRALGILSKGKKKK